MKKIRRYLGICALGLFAGFLDARESFAGPRTIQMTLEQKILLQEAFRIAAEKTRTCPLLAQSAPWLQKRMLESFESNDVEVTLTERNPDLLYECAYSHPSWVMPTRRMVLRSVAFHPNCRLLAAIIFHEMVHMNWTYIAEPGRLGWGSEEQVSALELACVPEAPQEPPALTVQR